MATLGLDLGRRRISRLGWTLLAINLVFTAGTALFIHEWGERGWHGPSGRWLIDHVLVQFHLATENVVAAWYSSMLLLAVGVAALIAFTLDGRAAAVMPAGGAARPARHSVLRWGWLVVAVAFDGLSLDELGSLHERLGMLRHGGAAATGWVYVLLVPIALVGLFMLAFAWSHLRRVKSAAALFVLGTALFLSDPIFELAEMSLLRAGMGNDLAIHNVLLVIEEGIIELGGALCFLLGVLTYTRRTAGEGPHVFALDDARAVTWGATAGLALTAGVPAAHWFVAQLPPGDTGIPDDWFPAAALTLAALAWLAVRGRRALPLAVACLAVSAAFGAALHGYVGWFAKIGYPTEALDAAVTAGASVLGLHALTAGASGWQPRRLPTGNRV